MSGLRQLPPKHRRQKSQRDDCRAADKRCCGKTCVFSEKDAKHRADERRARIKMLHEDIRALTCQNISQNSSADSREHTDADEKERSVITVFLKCGLYSDDGETPSPSESMTSMTIS